MTANAIEGDRDVCLQAGKNDYVSKPVKPAELINALRRSPSRESLRNSPLVANSTSNHPPDAFR